MKLNVDTDSLSIKDLEDLLFSIQKEISERRTKRSVIGRRHVLTADERLERLRKRDSAMHPNMVRIFGEGDKNSFLVPFRMADTGYKLVKAYDFRKAVRKHVPFAWTSGFKEGERAFGMEEVHSNDKNVLICGIDAFKDGGEEDFNHPRFSI